MAFSVTGPGFTVERTALATIAFNNPGPGIGNLYVLANIGGIAYGAWFLSDPTTMFYLGGSSGIFVPATSLTLKLRPKGGWPGDVQLSYAAYNEAGGFVDEGGLSFSIIDTASTPEPIPIGVGQGGIGFGLD